MRRPRTIASILGLMLTTGAASAASAQSTTNGPASAGPLVLTPIRSAIVFSPDAKVTTLNDKTAVLAGRYAGKLIEHSVNVGAGYRATTAADGLNELLRGATGSVGMQFTIGK